MPCRDKTTVVRLDGEVSFWLHIHVYRREVCCVPCYPQNTPYDFRPVVTETVVMLYTQHRVGAAAVCKFSPDIWTKNKGQSQQDRTSTHRVLMALLWGTPTPHVLHTSVKLRLVSPVMTQQACPL